MILEPAIPNQRGFTQITLKRETGEAAGTLILEFETEGYRLRRWIIEDALGVQLR